MLVFASGTARDCACSHRACDRVLNPSTILIAQNCTTDRVATPISPTSLSNAVGVRTAPHVIAPSSSTHPVLASYRAAAPMRCDASFTRTSPISTIMSKVHSQLGARAAARGEPAEDLAAIAGKFALVPR